MFRTSALLAAVSVGVPMLAADAEARIACRGGYQVVNGSEIATPYCQDAYLASVAREYGVRVSDATIRQNPNRKSEICRLIGRDSRVEINCAEENSRGRD